MFTFTNRFSNSLSIRTKNSNCYKIKRKELLTFTNRFSNSLSIRTKNSNCHKIKRKELFTLKNRFSNSQSIRTKKFYLIVQIPISFGLGACVTLFDFSSIRIGDCSPPNSPKNVLKIYLNILCGTVV